MQKKTLKTPDYVLRAVKKYNHSPKGRAARKKYLADHKEEVSAYNKKYGRNRRKKAKKEGICMQCFKEKALKGMSRCKICFGDDL